LKNFTFTRHKFLLVTVEEWLKALLNYRSYPQVNLGIRFFKNHPVCTTAPCAWCSQDCTWNIKKQSFGNHKSSYTFK